MQNILAQAHFTRFVLSQVQWFSATVLRAVWGSQAPFAQP